MRGDQSFRVTEQIFSDTTDGREKFSLCVKKKCVWDGKKGNCK